METPILLVLRQAVRIILLFLFFVIGMALPLLAQQTYRLGKAPTINPSKKPPPGSALILRLPVIIDPRTTTEFFYRGREAALQPLVTVMNRYLDSLAWLPAGDPMLVGPSVKGVPSLFVGSAEAETAPPSASVLRETHDKFPPMVLHLDKPSETWKARMTNYLVETRADYALLFWIGFNEYPKANKGIFKKKVVMGTGYEPEVRFLSAEDKPVEVLQLTGLLIRKDGEVIKAGAEAFLYEDTPFWAQALEIGTSIDDRQIGHSISDQRRDDLPGRPPAWQVALQHLLEQLTGRKVR